MIRCIACVGTGKLGWGPCETCSGGGLVPPAASEAPPPPAAACAADADPHAAYMARLYAEKEERQRLWTARLQTQRTVFLSGLLLPELAEEVRRLQRDRPDARAQWAAHCVEQSGGVKDPLKHTMASLRDFLSR